MDGLVGLVFKEESRYVALTVLDQAGLRLTEVLLPPPPMCWGIKVVPAPALLPSNLLGSFSLLLT